MKKAKCPQCIFRANSIVYSCDYAFLMGRVRGAVPPEECTHFIKGPRVESKQQALCIALGKKPSKKKPSPFESRKTKHDYKAVEQLYNQGLNDHQIGEKLNMGHGMVYFWRKATGRPPNTYVRGKGEAKREREEKLKKRSDNDAVE